jgi:hypothetical protein
VPNISHGFGEYLRFRGSKSIPAARLGSELVLLNLLDKPVGDERMPPYPEEFPQSILRIVPTVCGIKAYDRKWPWPIDNGIKNDTISRSDGIKFDPIP